MSKKDTTPDVVKKTKSLPDMRQTENKNKTQEASVHFAGERTDNHGLVEKAENSRGTLKRLISYFGGFRGLFAVLVGIVVLVSAAQVAIPALEGDAIDDIFYGRRQQLTTAVVWLIVLFAVQALCQFLQTRFIAKLSLSITRKLRTDLFRHIVRLPIKYIDTHSNGDILSRMVNDVENISTTLSQSLGSFIGAVLSIVGTLAVMLVYCWQLTLVTMCVVVLTVVSTRILSKIMAKQYRKRAAINGRLNGCVEEMVTGHKSVTAYNMEDFAEDRFNSVSKEFRSVSIKAESLSNGVGPVLDCIANVGLVVVATFGGYFALEGMITIGVVSAFIVYAKQFIRPVNEVAQIYGAIQTAIAGAERVFAMMDEPAEETETGDSRTDASETITEGPIAGCAQNADKEEQAGNSVSGVPADSALGAVSYRNVNFSYVPGKPVIKDFSLDIRPGQKIALVGQTGSGKTTITALLERFYDIDSGNITIDGKSIYGIPLGELRKELAVVLQDTVLFSGTIAENIKYADPKASDEAMLRAAEISNCSGFIGNLPDGYETKLVRAGANLSQGQRQLLTIARAVMADPKILILDEATSSVDSRTEKQIQDAMAGLMKDRTSLIIAHRLSTVMDADLIVVMNDGQIAETGTHNELIAARGMYYSLYMTQFAGREI